MTDNQRLAKRNGMVMVLLLSLILISYSNTFNAAWHLDDYHNIVRNTDLHPKDLKPDSWVSALSKSIDSKRRMHRPLPRLSFALNWYLDRDNVTGYHMVNIGIHLVTAFFLYLTMVALLISPRLGDRFKGHATSIALLATCLWAINPLQTQAVTYIVQRMASMAAMFYILALYGYVKGRTEGIRATRIGWYLGTGAFTVMALASKENTITLPIAILLIEFLFLKDLESLRNKKRLVGATIFLGILVVIAGLLLFYVVKGNPITYIQGQYAGRPFTLSERLLTQPRIQILYLSQLFYPIPSRLSIVHDLVISKTFWHPWTTLPALLAILALIGVGLSQIKSRPLVALGILFYFLNHLIESSILPLELVFEHRNYLPSLFLFLPVAAGLQGAIDHYRKQQPSIAWLLTAFIPLLLIGLGTGTYIRNMAWMTEKSLWEDAIAKAPHSGRAYHNLAFGYYQRTGRFNEALHYYKLAIAKVDHVGRQAFASLNNMANIYYTTGRYDQAAVLFARALTINPQADKAVYRLVQSLNRLERFVEADKILDHCNPRQRQQVMYLNLKGFSLLRQQAPQEALDFFRRSLEANFDQKDVWLHMGIAYGSINRYQQSIRYLKRANQMAPNDPVPLLYLIQVGQVAQNNSLVQRYVNRLVDDFSVVAVRQALDRWPDQRFPVIESKKALCRTIAAQIDRVADRINPPDHRDGALP